MSDFLEALPGIILIALCIMFPPLGIAVVFLLLLSRN